VLGLELNSPEILGETPAVLVFKVDLSQIPAFLLVSWNLTRA
jgi:hypothetical protein